MIKITTWTPDTCGCEIHYSWDDSVPSEQRVHTPVEELIQNNGQIRKRKVCPIHSAVAGNGKHIQHHDLVVEENQRKNKAIGHILENSPKLYDLVLGEDGMPLKIFKKGMEPEWSFDEDRNLKIKLKGNLLKKDKDDLKDSVQTNFQKVILE